MRILAPAKINIGLRVIRKRSDTYHDIETVFYPIHLADELEISKSDRHEFYSNIELKADANLCLRSLDFFCERTGINAEVKIVLKKNIPIGSGLGAAAQTLLQFFSRFRHYTENLSAKSNSVTSQFSWVQTSHSS